jgi:benzoylformate decarboxylase
MAAAMGVKLARPDSPVVSIVGDGSFLFSGPQPLWSICRYEVPITIIVLNNRSYNNERNRIWAFEGGAQLRMGLDMTCYNGSPNVDFVKAAVAFGVEGEVVAQPERIRAALERAKRANAEGRPYLLEMVIDRNGIGAASEWYPRLSIASLRTRKV